MARQGVPAMLPAPQANSMRSIEVKAMSDLSRNGIPVNGV
jgi:hypothetical protein